MAITETFDGTGALDSNWTQQTANAITRASDQAAPTGENEGAAFYSGVTWDNDQAVECIRPVILQSAGPMVRASSTGGSANHYRVVGNGTIEQIIVSRVGGSDTYLQFTGETPTDTNDVVRLSVAGTTLRTYINGVQRGTDQIDSSLASGAPGLYFGANPGAGGADRIDNWSGEGEPPPLAIGGSLTQGVGAPPQLLAGSELIAGTLAQGVGAPPQSLAGSELFSGAASQGAGAPPQAAFGSETFAGAITQGVAAPPQTLTGSESIAGAAAQGVGAPPQSLAGSELITGSAGQGVGAPPQAALGTTGNDVVGTLSQGVGGVPQAAEGEVEPPLYVPVLDRSGGGGALGASDLYWQPKSANRRGRIRQGVGAPAQSARGHVVNPSRLEALPETVLAEPDSGPEAGRARAGDRLDVRPAPAGRPDDPDRTRELPARQFLVTVEGSADKRLVSIGDPAGKRVWIESDRWVAARVSVVRVEAVSGSFTAVHLAAPGQSALGTVSDDELAIAVLLLGDD